MSPFYPATDRHFAYSSSSIGAGSQPKGLAAGVGSSHVFLATSKDVSIISNGSKSATVPLPNASPLCIATNKAGTLVAVGTEDSKVAIFAHADDALTKKGELELRAAPSQLAFSPDDVHLAVGLSNGKTPLYDVQKLALVHARWADTTAKVNALVWNADGSLLASASLDESVRVYSLAKPSSVVSAKNVHRGGVSSLVWQGEDALVSGGADGAIKKLSLKLA